MTKALKRENEAITHAAIDMICALMQPMHQDYDLHREQLNKSSLLSTQVFLKALLDMWVAHIVSKYLFKELFYSPSGKMCSRN